VKRHFVVGAAVVSVFVFAGALAMSYIGWWTLPLGAVVVAGTWLGGRCWHRDVSLLPPVPGGGPDREYARWHCNGCGATWASGLESSTRPRPRYFGYDQAKAAQAAVRADTLERERRRLAMERAGLSKKSPVTVAVDTVSAAPLTRVANGGRVRRLSVDAAATNLDDGRLGHRRPGDNLPRIRPLRG
jgi:hypothetical protein